jgi:hypothetical protein
MIRLTPENVSDEFTASDVDAMLGRLNVLGVAWLRIASAALTFAV